MSNILFVADKGDLYRIDVKSLTRPLTEGGHSIEEAFKNERLTQAMLDGSVDIVVVYGKPEWFFDTLKKARDAGSTIPIIFISTIKKKLPGKLSKMQIHYGAILPSRLAEMVSETLS